MRLRNVVYCGLVLAIALCIGAGARPAQADWQGLANQPPAADPAWEKYAFDLSYIDGSGKLSFQELAQSGQPFILVWWLTECPVCHLQMPYIQQLQNQIEEYGLDLRIVAINVDEDDREGQEYVKDKDLSFEVLFDQRARKTNAEYHVEDLGTPLTYVFDSGGEYVDYLTGFKNEYAKTIFKLLGITPPAKSRSGK